MYEKTNEQAYNLLPKQKKTYVPDKSRNRFFERTISRHQLWNIARKEKLKLIPANPACSECQRWRTSRWAKLLHSRLWWPQKDSFSFLSPLSVLVFSVSPVFLLFSVFFFPFLPSFTFLLLCSVSFFFLSHSSEGFLVSKKSLLSLSLFCLRLSLFFFPLGH
jgi:hypothetical protein